MRRSHLGVPVLGDDHHIKQTPELRSRVHQVVYERHKAVGSLDRHCVVRRASMKKIIQGRHPVLHARSFASVQSGASAGTSQTHLDRRP